MLEDARTRRLKADLEKLRALEARSGGALAIESTSGTPPSSFIVRLRCRGIERVVGDKPVLRDEHRLEIKVAAAYPLAAPYVRLLTPIFHPHVFENNQVCLGSRWVVGEGLDNLVVRLGAILRGAPEYFDFNSPANGAAADWYEEHPDLFPLQGDPFAGGAVPGAAPAGRKITWQDETGQGD